jgi:hypothetical protein
VTRKNRPPHTYLTDMERQNLDILVRRAASHLGPEERALLLRLHARHLQDARYARGALIGVSSKLDHLRRRAQLAEDQLGAPCEEPLPEPLGIGSQSYPLGPCIVAGSHDEHRDARGARWTLHEGARS